MRGGGGFVLPATLLALAALLPWLTLLMAQALLHDRLAVAAERAAVAAAAADHLLDAWQASGGEASMPASWGEACPVARVEVVQGASARTITIAVAFEGVEVVRYRAATP